MAANILGEYPLSNYEGGPTGEFLQIMLVHDYNSSFVSRIRIGMISSIHGTASYGLLNVEELRDLLAQIDATNQQAAELLERSESNEPAPTSDPSQPLETSSDTTETPANGQSIAVPQAGGKRRKRRID